MEPNLRHPPKKMGKNDQRVGAQADRPAILYQYQSNCHQEKKKKKRSARTFIMIELKKKISKCSTELQTNCFSIKNLLHTL